MQTGPSRSGRWLTLALLLLVPTSQAIAHTSERAFILLLPTHLFQVGGTLAVAASFLIVIWLRPDSLRRWLEQQALVAISVAPRVAALNWLGFIALAGLLLAGFIGSRDPLANPLPLSIWTLTWVGLTLLHALFGNFWPLLNPWTALAALLRYLPPFRGWAEAPPFSYPKGLGHWPAVAALLAFAWFELVHPAPSDPAVLAWAIIGYSAVTVTGMLLYGDAAWLRQVEVFSQFFRMVSWLAPLQASATPGDAERRRLVVVLPGSRLLSVGELPIAGVAFVILALATVSFDGLARTFWWLDLVGENPLEHPGRTALVLRNSVGLLAAAFALFGAYAICVTIGTRLRRTAAAKTRHLRVLVVSIVPIAFAYHFAHYLPSFLVDAQYAFKALSDPFARGWNLLGALDMHVTASLLSHHRFVELIWYTQVLGVVVGHVAAVCIAHASLGADAKTRTAAALTELPLTVLMIGYTMFGLWLLSTPVAG